MNFCFYFPVFIPEKKITGYSLHCTQNLKRASFISSFYIKANIGQQTKTDDFLFYSLYLEQTVFVHSFIPLKIIAIAQVEKEQSIRILPVLPSVETNDFLIYKTH